MSGMTWVDVVRATLAGEQLPEPTPEVPEPEDPRRYAQPAPAAPTRHDRPVLPPERHEPRTPL